MPVFTQRPQHPDTVEEGETVQTLNELLYSPFRPALTFLERSENKQMFSESQGDLETIN